MKFYQKLITMTLLSTLLLCLMNVFSYNSYIESMKESSQSWNASNSDDLKMTVNELKTTADDLREIIGNLKNADELKLIIAELNFTECNLSMTSITKYTVSMATPQSWFTSAYIINEELLCQNERTDILFYVHSAPNNLNRRIVIRRTWGSNKFYKGYHLTVVFLLGDAIDRSINRRILRESHNHHDIIQGTFRDTYLNLTYKARMALTWVKNCCSNTKYIVKTDDDVFVNIPVLIKKLEELKINYDTDDLLMCRVIEGAVVIRDRRYKNHVTEQEYAIHEPDIFPDFCPGWSVVYSTEAFLKINRAICDYPRFISVDDVYLTGILAKLAGIHHTDSSSFTGIAKEDQWKEYLELNNSKFNQLIFVLVERKTERIGTLWDKQQQF